MKAQLTVIGTQISPSPATDPAAPSPDHTGRTGAGQIGTADRLFRTFHSSMGRQPAAALGGAPRTGGRNIAEISMYVAQSRR